MSESKQQTGAIQKAPEKKLTAGERFTQKVMQEFSGSTGLNIDQMPASQKNLIAGYFIGIDRALKVAETDRIRKNASEYTKVKNDLPYTWENVNLTDVALDVVYYSKIGLDMMAKNNIFPIPYKNNATKKYDISFMKGFVGIELEALKYAIEKPKDVTCELVYDTDEFIEIKKDSKHPTESYIFNIKNPFDRGNIKGGFGYIQYDDPTKNKLVTLSYAEILKRKPAYASAEFWGGEKDKWETGQDGKRHKTTETVDGWHKEMCEKTLKRFVYNEANMPRDPEKVDSSVARAKQREDEAERALIEAEVDDNTGRVMIGEEDYVELDPGTGEVTEPEPDAATAPGTKDKKQPF